MKGVLEFANIFYHKRFLLEKQERITALFGSVPAEQLLDQAKTQVSN